MKILLIDDDPDLLRMLEDGLKLSFPTFTIESAASAEDAEQRLAEGYVPELVITDVRMPGKSGVELMLDLRQSLPDVQFILTSGYAPPELPGPAGEQVLRFLQKPFELAQLFSEVQTAYMRDQSSTSHRAITFVDVLQVLNMARRTGLVQLLRDGRQLGDIYLKKGEVHHSATGELDGLDALRALCAESDVTFRVRSGQEPPRRTIDIDFAVLMLDVIGDGDA